MHPTSDIAFFARTVDLGTFAAVGAETGLTASGVSRIVTRLESRSAQSCCIERPGSWC